MMKPDPNGFLIKFDNGLSLSIRMSPFHYCSKPNKDGMYETVEVAVFDKDNVFLSLLETDDVVGNVLTSSVINFIPVVKRGRYLEITGFFRPPKNWSDTLKSLGGGVTPQ